MKILLYLMALLILSSSCNLQSKEEPKPKQKDSYFSLQEKGWINKLTEWNVVRYNDSAKWRVYCYYGDDSCTKGDKKQQLPPIPLGYLNLKLVFASYRNDTLDLLYSFIYNDSTEVLYTNNQNKEIIDRYKSAYGVSFNTKVDTVIGYTTGNGTFWERGPLVRYENFTHPDLVRFIKGNKGRLASWFRNEGIRRGVLIE